MTRRNAKVRLLHMRDYAKQAVEMIRDRAREDVDADDMLRLALTHLVELVGEAASQIPPDIREQYPQIPWPKVIGMRHRLVHGYDKVDYDILWETITSNLPPLIETLERIVDGEA